MTVIEGKLINFKNNSYMSKEGVLKEVFNIMLENVGADQRQAELTVNVPSEIVKKHKLEDPKIIDAVRGKPIFVRGFLYDFGTVATGASGKPYSRKSLIFSVKDIAFEPVKA